MNTLTASSSLQMTASNYSGSNNNAANSVALTLDQTQLQQITALMNEMQQQDLQFNSTSGAVDSLANTTASSSISGNANAISIDIVNNGEANMNANQASHIIFSPDSIVKLESQIQYEQSDATSQQQQQQIFMQNHHQQQQQQLIENQQQAPQVTQVHTIMLNGQPALFIPASSAMSSNLLSQMLMNNSNNNNNNGCHANNNGGESAAGLMANQQTFDLSSLQVPMQMSLGQNQLMSISSSKHFNRIFSRRFIEPINKIKMRIFALNLR